MPKSEEYVSGEKYRQMAADRVNNKSFFSKSGPAIIAAVVVLMGLSFYGGIAYQKGKHPNAVSSSVTGTAGAGFGGRRGQFGGQRPTIGSVTAVSATSITVQDSNTGASTTLAITASTQITNNGQTAAASDIQTGDTILVIASTTDKTQAARILINPSFGGGGGAAGAPSPTTTN
ncbi:MAG TPA: hypothetical protein VII55_03780 [Candidatus Saccharimonadales bacterium]